MIRDLKSLRSTSGNINLKKHTRQSDSIQDTYLIEQPIKYQSNVLRPRSYFSVVQLLVSVAWIQVYFRADKCHGKVGLREKANLRELRGDINTNTYARNLGYVVFQKFFFKSRIHPCHEVSQSNPEETLQNSPKTDWTCQTISGMPPIAAPFFCSQPCETVLRSGKCIGYTVCPLPAHSARQELQPRIYGAACGR